MDNNAGKSTESAEEKPGNGEQVGAQPLLSVIIPVYNVEAYLRRCLDSVCSQSYRNLEVICVDDGSTDSSLSILREYEARDSRVRVVTQKNSRQATARNVALDMARGEWVTGVDSDDYMLPDAYSRAMAHATSEVDAVCFGMKVEAEPGLEWRVKDVHRFSNFKYTGRREMDARCITGIAWYYVNKIYRRSLIEEHGLRFDVTNCGCEDMLFHMCFCACARKAYFLREELYVYALRQGSTCHSASKAELRVRSYVSCFERVLAIYSEKRGLDASLPMVELLQVVMFRDSAPWAFLCDMALECRRQLLQVAARYGLLSMPAVAPALHELAEQLRQAQRAADVLRACAATASHTPAPGTALDSPLHAALPVDERGAALALEFARSLKQAAAAAGRAVCLHVVGGGVGSAACERMRALAEGGFGVCIHRVDATMLHSLPPLSAEGDYTAYLKMALPHLLPEVSRVLVLSPGLICSGELPDVSSLPMEGMPVAVFKGLSLQKGTTSPSPQVGDDDDSTAALVLDLEALRACSGMETWLAACFFHPHCLPCAEADSFNLAFQGRKAFLPAEAVSGWRVADPAELARCPLDASGSFWVGLPLDAQRDAAWSPVALPPELLLSLSGSIRRRYWGCRLMALLAHGSRHRQYQARCRAYRQALEKMRTIRERSLRMLDS